MREPGADLAAAAALLSSFKGKPLPAKTLFIGELGLTGAVRGVVQLPARLKEAGRMGFEQAFIPDQDVKDKTDIRIHHLHSVQELKSRILS